MPKSIRGIKKSRGRPRTTGSGIQIGLRWQAAELAAIDDWRRRQDDQLSRAEAIRRLVETALGPSKPGTSKAGAHRASKLAMQEIEPLIDKSEPAEIQERRKRRLIHGPKEFRGVRKDQPKGKA